MHGPLFEILPKKINILVAVHNNSGRKKNKLNEKKEEWIENFLERSNITHIAPGRRNTVYVGIDVGKREYNQQQYLLWNFVTYHSQKLLSMNSHFDKCRTSSKCIKRWLTTVTSHTLLFMWSLWKRFTFSERNKFKFDVKWYIIVHCSWSERNTHMRFELKGFHVLKLFEMFKTRTIVVWFQSRCWFDLFFKIAMLEKKIVKVNQTMLFRQVIPKWVETISDLKKAYKQKRWASWNSKCIFWSAKLQYFYFLFILPWSRTRQFGNNPYRSD